MRVLVIGCGSIGARRARLLAEMGHEVWGIDENPVRAAKATGGQALTPEMAFQLQVPYDAAFICTPAATHVEIAHACVEKGTPAFVEKPLALTMDGVPELVEEAERRSVVTMGACNMRWAYRPEPDPGGDLVMMMAKPLSQWRPGAEAAYRANGLLLEAAIHEIDIAYALHGEIEAVDAQGSHEAAILHLDHANGRQSRIYASWAEGDPEMRWRAWENPALHAIRYRPDTSDEMYRLEMQHFLECVAEGRETCNPLRSAAHVLEWAIKAQEQIRMVVA